MAVFGRIISGLLRSARRDWTVAAENTQRSVQEQTDRPTALKTEQAWVAYTMLLMVNW
jgi:hypothetical protein